MQKTDPFYCSDIEFLQERALEKTFLALLYLPHRSPRMARRCFNQWIARHPELSEQLALSGYSVCQRLLTPAQVGLIVKYLGEP